MTSEFIVDPQFYQQNNPDLVPAGIDTPEELLTHWQLFGRFEERISSPFYEELLEQLLSDARRGLVNLPDTFFSENAVIDEAGDPNRLPFAGQWVGDDAIEQYRDELANTLLVSEFKPLEFIEEGNKLAIRLKQEGQIAETGEDFERNVVHLVTLDNNGLITSLESFANTYPLNEGVAGLTPTPVAEGDLVGVPLDRNPTFNSEQARQIARGFWEGLAAGTQEGFEAALGSLSEDVVWSFASGSDPNFLPYSGVFNGVDLTGATGVLRSLGGLQSIVQGGPISVVETFAEGNRALVRLREEGAVVKATQNPYNLDILSWFTIGNDGQIDAVETVVDTNLTVQNLRPETANTVQPGGLYPFPTTESVPTPPFFTTITRENGLLVTYDEEGNFEGVLGEANNFDTEDFLLPVALTYGDDGDIYVTAPGRVGIEGLEDVLVNKVLRFDGVSGEFKGTFGDASPEGSLIDPATGQPTTDPSTGVPALIGPTGIKFGPDGDLYVASGFSSQIAKYDGETGQFEGIFARRENGFPGNIVVPSPEAGYPDFVVTVFGPDGNLYVSSIRSDQDGNPENGFGSVLRFAGPNSENPGAPLGVGEFAAEGVFGDANGTTGFLVEPSAIAFGPDLNLYVNSGKLGQVMKFAGPFADNPGEFLGVAADVEANVLDETLGAEEAFVLSGLGFGPDGNMYVGSYLIDEEKFIPFEGQVSVFAGPNSSNPGQYLGPFGDATVEDSNVIIPVTPEFVYFDNTYKEFNTPPRRFLQPAFLVPSNVDPNGFFGSDEGDAIAAYDENGAFIGFWSKFDGTDNPLDGIGGMKLGPNGNLLVSSQISDEVLEYDALSGKFIGVFGDASSTGSGLDFPADLTVGPDNEVYVNSLETEQILKYDGLTGQLIGVFAEGNTGDEQVERFTGLDFGPDGNLYVGVNPDVTNPSLGQAKVAVYSGSTGQLINTIDGFDFISALTFGPNGRLYVSDEAATILDFSNPNSPVPVAPTEPGRIAIYDTPGQLVGEFDVPTGGAGAVSFSPDGLLYTGSGATGTVVAYDPSTGTAVQTIEVPGSTGGAGRPSSVVFFDSELQSPILQESEAFPVP